MSDNAIKKLDKILKPEVRPEDTITIRLIHRNSVTGERSEVERVMNIDLLQACATDVMKKQFDIERKMLGDAIGFKLIN